MRRLRPKVLPILAVAALAASAAACGHGAAATASTTATGTAAAAPGGSTNGDASPAALASPIGRYSRALDPQAGTTHLTSGVDLIPIHVPTWIFGFPIVDPMIQPGSTTLAAAVTGESRLAVTALPSPARTAAVDLLEVSPPGHPWGELMIPAERVLLRAFASDPALGDSLVIVDDVRILRRQDPIPLTAYRWDRAAVETYAACGIPDRTIDDCTVRFYGAGETIIVGQFGFAHGR